MSTINVTNLSGRGGATPNLPDGAIISGVTTATNVSVSGAVTATTFDGSLKSTGTPTLGLGVTINASGVAISGVLTATTLKGDGSNLTGVGESIAPYYYNPDVNDTAVTIGTGIGITFNKRVVAGSGTATLKIVNAGAAGTTIQSWGISSATFPSSAVESFSLGSLVSDLIINQTYQLDIPEGFVVSSTGTNYAGTAYTFTVQGAENKLWVWGLNQFGQLGQNHGDDRSSPVQLPSPVAWKAGWGSGETDDGYMMGTVKTDGTLWMWGNNGYGAIGNGTANNLRYSSPVQIPGTTWSNVSVANYGAAAIKTDGTLWAWGYNGTGALGQNSVAHSSSPVQVGSNTTWATTAHSGSEIIATKTDGTLWSWGTNTEGQLGTNDIVKYSSPVQIPGTTWSRVAMSNAATIALKTNGTLWTWGENNYGHLGQNNRTSYSSPVQVPGTTWALIDGRYAAAIATKTDGTLWTWGNGSTGGGGDNSTINRSSPVQVPGTSWPTSNIEHIVGGMNFSASIKTDGTLWAWGINTKGSLGQNSVTNYSSPVQVGSLTDWDQVGTFCVNSLYAIQADQTP